MTIILNEIIMLLEKEHESIEDVIFTKGRGKKASPIAYNYLCGRRDEINYIIKNVNKMIKDMNKI